MNCSVFWDSTSCSPVKVNGRFGGTCRLYLQDRRVRVQHEAGNKQSERWFLSWLIFWSWRWRRHVPPKRQLTSTGLRGIISTFRYSLYLVHTLASKYLQAVSKSIFRLKGQENSVSMKFETKTFFIINIEWYGPKCHYLDDPKYFTHITPSFPVNPKSVWRKTW
jgi:hypothetical protein